VAHLAGLPLSEAGDGEALVGSLKVNFSGPDARHRPSLSRMPHDAVTARGVVDGNWPSALN
jgi:hypothetical protein